MLKLEDQGTLAASVFWLRFFGLSSLTFSVLGLLFNAWAVTPIQIKKTGFVRGKKPIEQIQSTRAAPAKPKKSITAPVANTDDEDSEDSGSISLGNPKDTQDVPDPSLTGGGVSVGGNQAGNVKTDPDIKTLEIDTNSGAGSQMIVTDFNYPDVEIIDIAKTLGKLTGKNFILDRNVKGKITIISNGPITVGDAWKAFLTALDINGFALIPSGKYIRISRQRDARDKQLDTFVTGKSPDSDALITRVFPLKYISAEEVARTFRSFMPANSRIIPYEQTNTVIVTDTGSNINKLAKMLDFLDVEGFEAGI
jgi:type II secretory pathway component HofQ